MLMGHLEAVEDTIERRVIQPIEGRETIRWRRNRLVQVVGIGYSRYSRWLVVSTVCQISTDSQIADLYHGSARNNLGGLGVSSEITHAMTVILRYGHVIGSKMMRPRTSSLDLKPQPALSKVAETVR
jgi:hypothetical protein